MTHFKHLAHIKTEFNPYVMKELVTGSTSLIKVSVMKDGYFLLIWVKFSNSTREMYANVESNQNEILPVFS